MATSFCDLPTSITTNILSSLLCFIFLPCVYSVSFQISRFGRDGNILYEGDAVPSVGAIEFNKVNYLCRVGRAIYAERVRLWDSNTGKLSDFSTHFSFIIDTRGATNYGHGLAFFLAPVGFQIPPNSDGGFLGLFNTTTSFSSQNQIIAVEFDSYSNEEWDPPFEHVGINNNSIASVTSTRWNASFHSGDTADTWITYNATTKNLTVFWSYEANPWVTIGFSAATGQYGERHTLLSWEFNSSLDIKEASEKNAKRKQMRRETAETTNLTSMNDDLERGAGPRRFSYGDLVSATNNFSEERKLGEGGFGGVYKGYIMDLDMAVAVKKISRGSKQGKKEYITEVKIISRLRHRNLVQLIGWCHDRGEFLLVYEFMPNGSLDFHLFGKKAPLSWAVRYKIALGVASALLYLHEEWEQCVVHRDIKSSNIMLDSSFSVKLGDFGLARLMDHELGPQTTGLAGTLGYLAPEYINTGKASKESDVFSFGVVALEIATGHILSAVDEKLHTDFDAKQVECLMIVGLWCAHPDRSLRASIRQAIQALKFEAVMPNLPPKMPVPMYYVPTPAVSSGEPFITNSSFEEGR
ncbi:L-type lectin-domain containing receptor kinase IX.1 [Vitis vinifera]|uniref:non-specific serine/threonine protein kinase n=1 Tax=Vitis vinifera TaxID=29760 RepID=A0A438KQ95_VITVI|nr:L-type lectin-domain containing receptor kinase IX.1 [Vitis vinifera]